MKNKRSAIKAALDDGGFGCLMVVLPLLGVYLWFDWAPWATDFTLYPVKCRDEATPIVDCGFFDRAPLNRSSYRLDAEQSQVLFRFNDMRGYSLTRLGFTRLADCRVIDRENWECPFGESGGENHLPQRRGDPNGRVSPHRVRGILGMVAAADRGQVFLSPASAIHPRIIAA